MRSDLWQKIRSKYEFSKKTKIDALKRDNFTCVDCNKKKKETRGGYLQVHHIVPIWFAVNYLPNITPSVLSSLENAVCLCVDCHEKRHITETKKEYIFLAQSLLSVSRV